MQAIGYARVSTTRQATEGVSLAAQRARIAAWCRANRYELTAIRVDAGVSGAKLSNRPALHAALAEATTAKATLVTYSLSRLARSTRDAIAISERLARAGAALVSLSEHIDTSTAAGKMVFRMLAVLAEFERDIVSERTKTAMQHKRARCEYTGGEAPYGYRVRRRAARLVPDAREQIMARRARTLRSTGLSLRAIGQRLAEEGFQPRCGRRWHAKTVGDLLTPKGSSLRS
jgi:site-specific DNA recombinase